MLAVGKVGQLGDFLQEPFLFLLAPLNILVFANVYVCLWLSVRHLRIFMYANI